jgi:hypothetical protein
LPEILASLIKGSMPTTTTPQQQQQSKLYTRRYTSYTRG